ncbi:MAG: hypothetical protein MUF87_03265 [Anaerolineae bacterium]|jgi:hypothetical protein|nr:hypothetical protein [Anaerolineae bacterium]
MRLAVYVLLIVLLAACDSGAVVFAPTPLPPDLSPMRYDHPSGAFSVNVPRHWAIFSQNTSVLATATFSPPDSVEPVLTLAVLNFGQAVEPTRLGAVLDQYQSFHRPDLNRYAEQDRQAMGDGSWRVTGVRRLTGGTPQAINTFLEQSGTMLGLIDVVITRDSRLQAELQTAINTFQINPDAPLEATELATFSFVYRAPLEAQNVATWQNAAGVFFVTGEVANYGETALAQVPVEVTLLAQDGTPITQLSDQVMGYRLPPGGFAPFSIRFGEGQPTDTISYQVVLGSGTTPPAVYGREVFQWTDESRFDADGTLVISGSVTHNGTAIAYDPIGVVTVFDSQQQVIGAWFTPIGAAVFDPGSERAFEIRVPEIGGDPVNYILEIQALSQREG